MSEAKLDNLSITVPEELQQGVNVINWSDTPASFDLCKLQVDEYGFFLGWNKKGKGGQVLDFSNVTDIRLGICPTDIGILKTLSKHHKEYDPNSSEGNEILGRRTLTLCSCQSDLVDVSYTNFVFIDETDRDHWYDTITNLGIIGSRRNIPPSWAFVKCWKKLLLSSMVEGKISLKSISRVFSTSSSVEKQVHNTANELGVCDGKKKDAIAAKDFTMDTFQKICNIIFPCKDIENIFQSITAGDEATMSQLTKFLNNQQRDPRMNTEKVPLYNKKQVTNIIKTYERDPVLSEMGLMSKDGFTTYVMSHEFSMIKKECLDVHQDMDQPLSHYFISSSHNTYLKGAQVKGKSSIEMYRQVLLSGCRCIELDCWDGAGLNFGEPIITHGNAFCTEILFKDVIVAIKECAFVKSTYPLILSFENHCSKLMQEKMAEYCNTIFGELLLKEPLEDFPTNAAKKLPSPSRLKYKILIKNKKMEKTKEKEELEHYWKRRQAFEAVKESKGNISGPSSLIHLAGVGQNTFSVGETPHSQVTDDENTTEVKCNELEEEKENIIMDENHSETESDSVSPNCNANRKTLLSTSQQRDNASTPKENHSVNVKDDSEVSQISFSSFELHPDNHLKIEEMRIDENKTKDLDSWSEGEEDTVYTPKEAIECNNFRDDSTNTETQGLKGKRKKGIFSSMKGKWRTKSDEGKIISSIQEEYNDSDIGTDLFDAETDNVLRREQPNPNKKLSRNKKSVKHDENRKSMVKTQIGLPSDFVHVTSSQLKTDQAHLGANESIKESNTIITDMETENYGCKTESNSVDDKSPYIDEEYYDDEEEDIPIIVKDVPRKRNKKASKDESKALPVAEKVIHPYLSSMVVYTQAKAFKGFHLAQVENLSHVISSFSESKSYELLKSHRAMLVRYNKRQLSRIYPKGVRVESSNLMPQEFWNAGCQLVCLNYQTADLPMQLNLGKFDCNGQSGYILKPDILRREDRNFDPFIDEPIDGIVPAIFSVQVISGYFLSDRKVGTYVVVELHGLPVDTTHKEYRTSSVPSNGLNPIYNSEVFKFQKIIFPELAMLRFAVYDDHDKLLGQRVLPIEAIQCGYRHISLRTVGNANLPLSMLFCKIDMDTYTPNDMQAFTDALVNPQSNIRVRKGSGADKSGRNDSCNEQINDEEMINETYNNDLEISHREEQKQFDNNSSTQPKSKMRIAKKRTKTSFSQ